MTNFVKGYLTFFLMFSQRRLKKIKLNKKSIKKEKIGAKKSPVIFTAGLI